MIQEPMAKPADSVMSRLKTATEDLHQYAEARPLQREMARGTLPREVFAQYLGQLFLVHQALEAQLDDARHRHAAIDAVYRDYQRRADALRGDLLFFGIDPIQQKPTSGASEVINQINRAAAHQPIALLGMLYVLEGSTNGSKFIARSLARAYDLKPGHPGLASLDPYGDLHPERWRQFKDDMTAVGFNADQQEDLVRAAQAMFRAIANISDELLAPSI